MKGRKRSTLFL